MLGGHTGAVLSIAVSADGSRIVTGSADGTARIWDAKTGRSLITLKDHRGSVSALAITHDGRRLFTGSDHPSDREDLSIRAWNMDDGHLTGTLSGHINLIHGLTVTPDDHRLVSASADYRPRVWDLDQGIQIRILWHHSSPVKGVAVTPDGKRVLTGSSDGTIWLWDLSSGVPLADLRWHSAGLNSIALSSDGMRLLTASDDGLARVWELVPRSGDIASARSKAPRCLTPAERKSYHLGTAPPDWCVKLQKWPYDREGSVIVANFLFGEGKVDEAETIIAAASKADPSLAKALDAPRAKGLNEIAWHRFVTGKPSDALADAEKAFALAPDDLSIIETRGQIYAALGHFKEALADLDKAVKGGVSAASTFAARGRANELLGNPAAAIADYREALTLPASYAHEQRAHDTARERLTALGASGQHQGGINPSAPSTAANEIECALISMVARSIVLHR